MNLAARLQQAAAPGEILLGRETYELVRDSVSVDEGSSLVLKGKRLPVTAYRLIDITAFGERPNRADPPLVGRADEIRQMREAFDLAVTQRACRLLTVTGTAGAGKSRLASEFVTGIEGEAITIEGRCLPYGDGITFWPVAEAVRELAGIDLDDPLEIARSKLQALLQRRRGIRIAVRPGRSSDRSRGRHRGDAGDILGDPPVAGAGGQGTPARRDPGRPAVGRTRAPRSSRVPPALVPGRPDPRPLPRPERSAGGTIRMGRPTCRTRRSFTCSRWQRRRSGR